MLSYTVKLQAVKNLYLFVSGLKRSASGVITPGCTDTDIDLKVDDLQPDEVDTQLYDVVEAITMPETRYVNVCVRVCV